jgi:DNA-binding response OmpR family regulator
MRLLIVDDDEMVREALADALDRPGREVRTAGSGTEALRLLEEGDREFLVKPLVLHYDRGGEPHSSLSREIRPLGLTPDDRAALGAFLRALSGSVGAGVR